MAGAMKMGSPLERPAGEEFSAAGSTPENSLPSPAPRKKKRGAELADEEIRAEVGEGFASFGGEGDDEGFPEDASLRIAGTGTEKFLFKPGGEASNPNEVPRRRAPKPKKAAINFDYGIAGALAGAGVDPEAARRQVAKEIAQIQAIKDSAADIAKSVEEQTGEAPSLRIVGLEPEEPQDSPAAEAQAAAPAPEDSPAPSHGKHFTVWSSRENPRVAWSSIENSDEGGAAKRKMRRSSQDPEAPNARRKMREALARRAPKPAAAPEPEAPADAAVGVAPDPEPAAPAPAPVAAPAPKVPRRRTRAEAAARAASVDATAGEGVIITGMAAEQGLDSTPTPAPAPAAAPAPELAPEAAPAPRQPRARRAKAPADSVLITAAPEAEAAPVPPPAAVAQPEAPAAAPEPEAPDAPQRRARRTVSAAHRLADEDRVALGRAQDAAPEAVAPLRAAAAESAGRAVFAERDLEAAVASASSFEQLYAAIRRAPAIIGSLGEYSAPDFIEVIEGVREGWAPLEAVTRTFGIREAVDRLRGAAPAPAPSLTPSPEAAAPAGAASPKPRRSSWLRRAMGSLGEAIENTDSVVNLPNAAPKPAGRLARFWDWLLYY